MPFSLSYYRITLNRKMKKVIFIAVLGFFTLNQQVNAQEIKAKPNKTEMLAKMQEKLSLSDAQVTQIKGINDKYESREADVKARMQKIKEEHKAIRNEKKAEMDKVLTAEQREKIKAWKEERKDKKKGQARKVQK